jgi:hypothetical protein
MQRLSVTCAALLALLAVSATASSSASAEKLTLSEGAAALEVGNTFWLYGFHNLFVTTRGLECETSSPGAVVGVSVLSNSKGRDELQIGRIEGGRLPAPCRSFTGNAFVALESLGEVLRLRATGEATVGPVDLLVGFEHEDYNGFRYFDIQCTYTRVRLSGTNTATGTAQKLHVNFEGTLPLNASRSSVKARRLCPGEVEMSLSLPFTENEQGEHPEVVEEQVAP